MFHMAYTIGPINSVKINTQFIICREVHLEVMTERLLYLNGGMKPAS